MPVTTPRPLPVPTASHRRRPALARFPVTLAGLVVLVAVGAAGGTFAGALPDRGWGPAVMYGWPHLVDGHWWSVLSGAAFAVTPALYVPVLLSFAAFVGLAERAVGGARAAGLWLVGHLVGVLGGLAVIGLADPALRSSLDAGPSAGALFAGYLAAGALTRRWRVLIRGGLLAYALTSYVAVHHVADTVHLVAVLAAAVAARTIADAWVRRDRRPGTADTRLVREQLRRHGGGTLGWMNTWRGLEHLVHPEGHIAFRVHLGVALALGDPVGTPAFRRAAPRLFAEHCRARGLRPVWFSTSAATADAAGGHRLVVATDNLLDLPDLAFRGKAWQDVRTARNRAAREGVTCWIGPLAAQSDDVIAQVRTISAAWLHDQRTPELGFTLGGLEEASDPAARVALAIDAHGTVHGVTSWLPVHAPGGRVRGWTLDVMRRGHDFGPVIEFLISEAAMAFRAEGAEVLSLSGAPLSGAAGPRAPRGSLQSLLDSCAGLLDPLYGFGSLHAFKRKFSPRAAEMLMVYPRRRDLPRIGAAVLVAYLRTPIVAQTPHVPAGASRAATGARGDRDRIPA